MTFISNYTTEKNKPIVLHNLFRWAFIKINNSKFGATEIILNNYCLENYNKDLRTICKIILLSTKFTSDNNGKIIGKIVDPKIDKLARFITYGNGKIKGSQIIKKSLTI